LGGECEGVFEGVIGWLMDGWGFGLVWSDVVDGNGALLVLNLRPRGRRRTETYQYESTTRTPLHQECS
jgi:hypothetical protein